MILIDDPKGLTIEKAFDMAKAEGLKPLYDTDLMLGSGHITGTFIPDGSPIAESIVNGLKTLKANNADGLLFLVGDGNHSLASAKAHWEISERVFLMRRSLTIPQDMHLPRSLISTTRALISSLSTESSSTFQVRNSSLRLRNTSRTTASDLTVLMTGLRHSLLLLKELRT